MQTYMLLRSFRLSLKHEKTLLQKDIELDNPKEGDVINVGVDSEGNSLPMQIKRVEYDINTDKTYCLLNPLNVDINKAWFRFSLEQRQIKLADLIQRYINAGWQIKLDPNAPHNTVPS